MGGPRRTLIPLWQARLRLAGMQQGAAMRVAAPCFAQSPPCFGNSGLPQRLQKLAPASWLGLSQVGQWRCSPPLPVRMALASSAVKMPVGTAMIE